jgi:hypothetical protein
MKKIFPFIVLIFIFFNIKGQVPQGFNYQGVARNASGVELANQAIGLQIVIYDSSPFNYIETHSVTTDANGLFTIKIGNGTPVSNTFAGINWATGGTKWLKISMDATGGTSYQLIGASELLSVPYALFAGNVSPNNGGAYKVILSDDVTDAQAAAIIASEVGPNTREIEILNTNNLTTVDFSQITKLNSIRINNNSALISVNFSGLISCQSSIIFEICPVLSSLNFSSLNRVNSGELKLLNTGINNITFASLTKLGANLSINTNPNLSSINMPSLLTSNAVEIIFNSVLASITFPLIQTTSFIGINSNPLLNSINFNVLHTINIDYYNSFLSNGINISGNNSLTSVAFPSLLQITNTIFTPFANYANISYNTALTSISLPVLTTIPTSFGFFFRNNALTSLNIPSLNYVGLGIGVQNNNLSSVSVNAILNKLVNLSPIIVSTANDLSGQSPLAPPTGQGIIDKATLIANGNTVTTD